MNLSASTFLRIWSVIHETDSASFWIILTQLSAPPLLCLRWISIGRNKTVKLQHRVRIRLSVDWHHQRHASQSHYVRHILLIEYYSSGSEVSTKGPVHTQSVHHIRLCCCCTKHVHRWPLVYLAARWLLFTTSPPCEGVAPMCSQANILSFHAQRPQWNNAQRSSYRGGRTTLISRIAGQFVSLDRPVD